MDRQIRIAVPEDLPAQLVYRRVVEEAPPPRDGKEAGFILVDGVKPLVRHFTLIKRHAGLLAACRVLLKILTPSRVFYFVVREASIVSTGWITVGQCKHYAIGRNDVVIGPLETAESQRGKGLASLALNAAMSAMTARGHRAAFVDTSVENGAMQRVLEKCGFGDPVACILRDPDTGELV